MSVLETGKRFAARLLLAAVCWLWPAGAGADAFAFVVLADPHIDGRPDRTRALVQAVTWIAENAKQHRFELVFVLGDLGWGTHGGKRNLVRVREILEPLNAAGAPYVPVLGDNEVQAGCAAEFATVFAPQYEHLAARVENFRRHPDPQARLSLQNFSFDHRGCHFVCPDFISRRAGDEGGDLHQGPGGSWEWFLADLDACAKPNRENTLIMTHIGLFQTHLPMADRYLFSSAQMELVRNTLFDRRHQVAANYAGHIHQSFHWLVSHRFFSPLYDVWTTDETWADPPELDQGLTVRWVEVNPDSDPVAYRQQVVALDSGD